MKIYVYILSIMIFVISCEIDKEPYDTLTDSFFWKTEQDFAMACNKLYPGLESHTDRDVFSEIGYGQERNEISSGTYTPTNSFGPWNNAYARIAECNKIIEEGESTLASGTLEGDIVNRYIGEARFFRAYHYYDLLRSYGGVPLVDKVLDLDSEILFGPRDSRSDVVNFILDDLDFAKDYLPNEDKLTASEEGRLTCTAALTFKSRVALYEGTRQKFHDGGDYLDLLEAAKNASLEVINSDQHQLFTYATNDPHDNYQFLFRYEGENCSESLLANRYILPWRKHNRSVTVLRHGVAIAPTRKMVDSYLCNDGLPIEHSPNFQGYTSGGSEFIDRDPRLNASIMVPYEDESWMGVPYVPDMGYGGSLTGYHFKKYGVIADAIALESDLDYMVIRYAEALLNYAEAVFEIDENISDEDLDISINKLRDRVGMVHLTNAFVNGTNPAGVVLNMREEIRRERLVELAMEGFRYDDLLRWGIAEDVLTQPIKGIPYLGDEYPKIQWSEYLIEDNFIVVQEAKTRFFEEKNYLWPIPLLQISLNNKLEQNPGW
jgi:starch-binding outer membrane protein, SusD/RagB family